VRARRNDLFELDISSLERHYNSTQEGQAKSRRNEGETKEGITNVMRGGNAKAKARKIASKKHDFKEE